MVIINIKEMIISGKIAKRKEKETPVNIYASGKDEKGIFTMVEYKRVSNTVLCKKSELSNKNPLTENYGTLVLREYKEDGVTEKSVTTWELSYDADNDIISSVQV